ncbi:MBL fold metallo-hydrolase [Sulfuriroseicoccus oceanibius]|uniref:MBL fold metallo-hydrolase n=1 Tax=Sulfuriroseicoccus oceanibius TaxID=2707525 RepID=A0A7T7F1H9_9BACT|nr:MBL fold metallo-hydrolase [Sulfuriroseicoccus oceanibius]QQL45105.1 MBL fold metallo-hydrolase [Sulfuriroseicoccus oceanibius]
MMIPLEDEFCDVMGKVLRGTNMTPGILEFLTGVPEATIETVLDGEPDECTVRRLAPALGLDGESLVAMMTGKSAPPAIEVPGLRAFNVAFDDMTVNYYVVWDATSKRALMFDTGANADEALEWMAHEGLSLDAVLLSHSHLDHIADVEKVRARYPEARVLMNAYEACEGVERFLPGQSFQFGGFEVGTAMVRGHSPGATVYTVTGLSRRLVVVGDALFARSMGGPLISLDGALEGARQAIFSLPDDTVLCPGHGPLTTVADEKTNNPFFPEFKD